MYILNHAVCMSVCVLWQLCTEKRVSADLSCDDSGVHLPFLLSVDLHHHPNVSACNYRFSNSAPNRSCKYFLKVVLLFLLCRSVVLIDGYAFADSGLLDVTVPSSVTFLGEVVFIH